MHPSTILIDYPFPSRNQQNSHNHNRNVTGIPHVSVGEVKVLLEPAYSSNRGEGGQAERLKPSP